MTSCRTKQEAHNCLFIFSHPVGGPEGTYWDPMTPHTIYAYAEPTPSTIAPFPF